jgi:hypothetical protein
MRRRRTPVSALETDVVVVKSPGPAEKVLAPVQRTGYPATSYSPGGLRYNGLKGVNGHPARAVRLAQLALACPDIIWWGTEIVRPVKGERTLFRDIPVGIEGVEHDIVGFIGALLEFYDNDNTRTRSHILERTLDLFSQMGTDGAVVRLISSSRWSPRLVDSSRSGRVDPKLCGPTQRFQG